MVEWYEEEGNLVAAKRARAELAEIMSNPGHEVNPAVLSARLLKFKTTHKRKVRAQGRG